MDQVKTIDTAARDLEPGYVKETVRRYRDSGLSDRIEIRDATLKGLVLRIGPSGPVWICAIKVQRNGRQAKKTWTLGRWPDMSISAARKAAEARRAERTGGTVRVQRRKPVTLQDAFEKYIAVHTDADLDMKPLRPSTVKNYQQHMRTPLQPWAAKPLLWFYDSQNLEAVRDELRATRTKSVASGSVRIIRLVANWYGAKHGRDQGLPRRVDQVALFRQPARQSKFAAEELKNWYAAAVKLDPLRRDAFLLAALTGQRSSIIAGLRWIDYDRANALLVIQEGAVGNKAGEMYRLPVSTAVASLLARRKAENAEMFGDSVFVFPSLASKTGHITLRSDDRLPAPQRYIDQRRAVGDEEGGKACHVHALRHTLIERAEADLGMRREDLKRLVGHKGVSGDATSVYTTRDAISPRLREENEKLSRYILRCFGLPSEHVFEVETLEDQAA